MEAGELAAVDVGIITRYLWELGGVSLLVLGRDGTILRCNAGFRSLLPRGEEPEGRPLAGYLADGSGFTPPDTLPGRALLSVGTGDTGPHLLSAAVFADEDKYVIFGEKTVPAGDEGMAYLSRELDRKTGELDRALEYISRIMDTDPLTGLGNRKFFMEMLKKSISFSNRSELPLALVMGDMDNFKFITETYGHEIRDKILVEFSDVLRRGTRAEDFSARFGGDEFALILPNTTPGEALRCAERLHSATKEIKVEKVAARISASFGVTGFRVQDTEESALQRLESALFKAKVAVPMRVVLL